MESSIFQNLFQNLSNSPELFFLFLILLPLVVSFILGSISKELEKKYAKILGMFFLFILMTFSIISSGIEYVNSKYICQTILDLKKDECSIKREVKNGETYKVIYIYGNFKLRKNKLDLENKKEDYYQSKDEFVVYLDRKLELFSSSTLDELIHKKNNILKMKDEYFEVKKKDLNKVGSL